jgi:hypothetical protein
MSCLPPTRSRHKIAKRAELVEPEGDEATRDQFGINHTTRDAIGLSLAIGFVVAAGSLFASSLVELIKLADRGMSDFMQNQLWMPRL